MPGVNVTTATRSGPTAQNTAPSGQVFMVGLAERGNVSTYEKVQGIADFESKFGSRVSYSHLYDNIATFFEEGGSVAYVTRVVGPAATKGFISVSDRATPAVQTVKFEAANPGAWSDPYTVTVTDLTGGVVEFVVANGSTTLERFTASTVEGIISAFADSAYIVATSLGSATTAPNNMPAQGTYDLTAGSDDRSSVTASTYTGALSRFVMGLGDGAVAIPGIGSTVHAGIIAHCVANRRIGLLSMAETDGISTLKTTAASLNSEYAGLFSPWVQISTTTGIRYTSPEGYVAAVRNRAHQEAGPWRAPAGQIAVARSVIGLKYDYTRAQGDELDAAKVSAIRLINNTIRLYGWRSLSNDTANYSLLNGRDLLNRLVFASEDSLEQYIFQTIDGKGQLLSAINGTLVGILEPIRRAGGVYERFTEGGDLIDPGYLVETGSTVNTLSNLANNEVKARVSVRISPSAALISVTIIKVGLLSNL